MSLQISDLKSKHWPIVRDIYAQGIATNNATFELQPPNWIEWNESHMACCRFVVAENNIIHGWAALSSVSTRCVYEGVAEVSVYVAADSQGKGLGTMLLRALIESSERARIWTLQAGIFPENRASINLHLKLGFRLVGRREKIGRMDGRWRDVFLLERRSQAPHLN